MTARGLSTQPDRAMADGTSLQRYVGLMHAFLTTEVSALDFERHYLDLFGDEEVLHPEATFQALNDVFFAVDAFCADQALRDIDDLDEDQLRARVRAALAMLNPSAAATLRTAS